MRAQEPWPKISAMPHELIRCPHCYSRLKVPETKLGSAFECPSCGKVIEPERVDFVRRYLKWCGLRSIIFQAALAAWTTVTVLAWLYMAMSMVAGDDPRMSKRENEQVAANALALMSCCSCGGYMLIAGPLGIAAVATLETKGRNDR